MNPSKIHPRNFLSTSPSPVCGPLPAARAHSALCHYNRDSLPERYLVGLICITFQRARLSSSTARPECGPHLTLAQAMRSLGLKKPLAMKLTLTCEIAHLQALKVARQGTAQLVAATSLQCAATGASMQGVSPFLRASDPRQLYFGKEKMLVASLVTAQQLDVNRLVTRKRGVQKVRVMIRHNTATYALC